MMFFLVPDVLPDFVQLRYADAERAIFFLPTEQAQFREGFMHPFGGAALDQLHGLGDRNGRWQGKQDMDVVRHAADFNGFHAVLTGNSAEERPEPFAESGRDELGPLFGAENTMKIGADAGHARYSAVPSGLVQCRIYPGVETPGYGRIVPPGQGAR